MQPEAKARFLERPILNGKVNFPLCLAPMVGLSHMALRLVCREYLPHQAVTIWPTEMLNSNRIPFEEVGKTPETLKLDSETELVPQVLGNEPRSLQASVEKLEAWGADGFDINMGCPVQKALRHNYGVALMGDPRYAAEVVKYARQATTKPISVKLRAGLQNDFDFLSRFVQGLVDEGADWITLHPRTAEQKRRGHADWSQIRRLREKIATPVIGNGDIQTSDDVYAMLSETGCDMVMAGRALAARPWMFWQVGEDLGFDPPPGRTGPAPRTPSAEAVEYGKSLLRLLEHLSTALPQPLALRKFRFHVRTTSVWLDFGHELYSISTRYSEIPVLRTEIEAFFQKPLEFVPKTDLRE